MTYDLRGDKVHWVSLGSGPQFGDLCLPRHVTVKLNEVVIDVDGL